MKLKLEFEYEFSTPERALLKALMEEPGTPTEIHVYTSEDICKLSQGYGLIKGYTWGPGWELTPLGRRVVEQINKRERYNLAETFLLSKGLSEDAVVIEGRVNKYLVRELLEEYIEYYYNQMPPVCQD